MNYIENAKRTDAKDYTEMANRAKENIRLLHGAIGLCTEVGEFQDALKKSVFYGKPLDKVNLVEELGDIMWYLAIICDELGTTFEKAQSINIEKLKLRFPDKFREHDALNRDLEKERELLEKGGGNE